MQRENYRDCIRFDLIAKTDVSYLSMKTRKDLQKNNEQQKTIKDFENKMIEK